VGAVPATIAVIDGELCVGLSPEQTAVLTGGESLKKLGSRDLAVAVAQRQTGGTTVSATVELAAAAGIRLFATGGIGGVHRGASSSFDVSTDLQALAKFPVAVVCAGAKAVLDLPRTVEMLETLGVPIYGVRTERFPAFYRRDAGLPVDEAFESIEALARAAHAHWALGGTTGIVVANPIPPEHEMPEALYDEALERALAEAAKRGVRGRGVTPFLLERLRALTEGRSVFSNLALLRHNARVGAQLACALAADAPR